MFFDPADTQASRQFVLLDSPLRERELFADVKRREISLKKGKGHRWQITRMILQT